MKKSSKILMFEHAGSGNHGCEAIVRTTCEMLGNQDYILQTASSYEDIQYGIDHLARLIELKPRPVKRNSWQGIKIRAQARLNPRYGYDDLESLYRNRDLICGETIALSIGGDNYCYAGIIGSMHDKLITFGIKKIPTVLWGCSIGRQYLSPMTIADLHKYSLITARESLTQEILADIGLVDNVISCADPAFTLPSQPVTWHDNAFTNAIGINVSAFMKYYDAYPEATYRNFSNLIDYLLKNTDANIVMIPHVRQIGNDDLETIRKLANHFQNDRILVVDEDFNCMQLKYIISRCKMFIGCRTHATIAAYSTCVPTLVVGYSTKAKGICKDLFGKYDNLLVDVREFKSDEDLTKIYIAFSEVEADLRYNLSRIMPKYIQRAYFARDAIMQRFGIEK